MKHYEDEVKLPTGYGWAWTHQWLRGFKVRSRFLTVQEYQEGVSGVFLGRVNPLGQGTAFNYAATIRFPTRKSAERTQKRLGLEKCTRIEEIADSRRNNRGFVIQRIYGQPVCLDDD